MRVLRMAALAAVVAGSAFVSTGASAQVEWVSLGCKDVGFNVDRDVIPVGRQREGRFMKVRLRARGNDVQMLDLTVVYIGGERDDLPVRSLIRANGQTPAMDLRGRERSIESIEMVYQVRPGFAGRATICADGLLNPVQAQQPVRGPVQAVPAVQWVELGCRDVGFQVDRDVIEVGRREGRFIKVRLRARGNDVNMISMRVIYGNGEPDELPVRALVRMNGQTPAMDLRGVRDRTIERIELIYQVRPQFRGRAVICADGLG